MVILGYKAGENMFGQGGAIMFGILSYLTAGFFPVLILPFGVFGWRLVVNHDVFT